MPGDNIIEYISLRSTTIYDTSFPAIKKNEVVKVKNSFLVDNVSGSGCSTHSIYPFSRHDYDCGLMS